VGSSYFDIHLCIFPLDTLDVWTVPFQPALLGLTDLKLDTVLNVQLTGLNPLTTHRPDLWDLHSIHRHLLSHPPHASFLTTRLAVLGRSPMVFD